MTPRQPGILIFLFLCGSLLGWAGLSAAQGGCGEATRFQFKGPASLYGQKSFLASEHQPLTVAVDLVLPPIIIEATYHPEQLKAGAPSPPDSRINGKTCSVEMVPPLRLGGTSVEFSQGGALFNSIVVQEKPTDVEARYKLLFTMSGVDGTVTQLISGNITFKHKATAAGHIDALTFGDYGYFGVKPTGNIPVNTQEDITANRQFPLPAFWLQLKNEFGYLVTEGSTSLNNVQVKVSAESTDTNGETTQVSFGTVRAPADSATMNLGALASVKVENLYVYAPASPGNTYTVKLIFEIVGTDKKLETAAATATTTLQRNRYMMFDTSSAISHFTYENIGNTAVLNVPMPPIVIRFYTSKLQPDVSNTGFVIAATCAQGTLTGGQALVVQGVATFKDLAFTGNSAIRSAVIVFNLVGGDQTLSSGVISVAMTAIKAKHFSFTHDSFAQANKRQYLRYRGGSINPGVIIHSIGIQMKDSGYQIDTTANDIDVDVIVGDARSVSATIQSGLAVLREQNFVISADSMNPSVVVRDGAGIRAPLVSAPFTVIKPDPFPANQPVDIGCKDEDPPNSLTPHCLFRLKFGHPSLSLVYQEGQDIFATLGMTLPTIRITLANIFEDEDIPAPDATKMPLLRVFTGDSYSGEPYLDIATTEATVFQGWEYKFNIKFDRAPTGLVRLQFQAYHPQQTNVPLAGIPIIRSGFVSIATQKTAAYGIRFASDDTDWSLIAYPTQRTSAVLNIALPPIVVEILNSAYDREESSSGMTVVATTEADVLHTDGATATVVKGRAKFSTLKFKAVTDEPILTFRVLQSTYAVSGKTVQTGRVTVTRLPIPMFRLALLPTKTDENNATKQYWPATYSSLQDANNRPVFVTLIALDSAHQREHSVKDIEIELLKNGVSSGNQFKMKDNCACLAEKVVLLKDNEELFVTFVVTDTGMINTPMKGKSVTLGPFAVEQEGAGGDAAATTRLTVMAKFKVALTEFEKQQTTYQDNIARMMGISADRVEFVGEPVTTRGVDYSTLAQWSGTKLEIWLKDPLADSTNQKSSAELTAEFLQLRPGCDAKSLNLAAVFSPSDDRDCNIELYNKYREERRTCHAGMGDMCDCYDSEAEGNDVEAFKKFKEQLERCQEEPSLDPDINTLCAELLHCGRVDASIEAMCSQVLSEKPASLFWVAAPAGGGLVLIVCLLAFLRYKGILKAKPRPKMNKYDNEK